jgi:GDP-L-fucose synthase
MQKDDKIYVAGHNGMVGSALVRRLKKEGFNNIIYRGSKYLDLTDQTAVQQFFKNEQPDHVFLAAAKVGGILANNTYRGQFIYENLMIQNNVIHASHLFGVKKLLFLGSSCIYPKHAEQPMKESALLTGVLEPTNEPYAIAKIAGVKMCEAYHQQYGHHFFSVMPTNLYGPNDNYDLQNSHVLPAFIRKFHEAKINGDTEVTIWGSGTPLREFMHVDDLADACLFMMQSKEWRVLTNIGSGEEISIKDLALLVKDIVGFEGKILHDRQKPDGTPRKLMDSSYLKKIGWNPGISLKNGIKFVYSKLENESWYAPSKIKEEVA